MSAPEEESSTVQVARIADSLVAIAKSSDGTLQYRLTVDGYNVHITVQRIPGNGGFPGRPTGVTFGQIHPGRPAHTPGWGAQAMAFAADPDEDDDVKEGWNGAGTPPAIKRAIRDSVTPAGGF